MNFAPFFDLGLIIPILGLAGISLAIIGSGSDFFPSQLIFFIFGAFIFFIISSIDYRIWKRFSWLFYIFSLFLFIGTFFNPSVRGSFRWIDLGIFRFQPTEIMKPFITIFFIFSLLNEEKINFWKFIKPFFILFPILFLIFRQPDLGNFLVYLFIFFSLEIIAGIPIFYLLLGIFISLFGLPVFWQLLAPYQKNRILAFINPYFDPQFSGYNAIQAMIAVGSGELFGLGLGRGTQSHLLFLPEHHTDFIFASIVEELGFIGGIMTMIFYFILLVRILKISESCEEDFGRFLSLGIFTQIFIQVFINLGMNLGVVPITGITLPLLSYGGSSIITVFISLGIVASIARIEKTKNLIVIR